MVLSVLVDPVYDLVVSGDCSGKVVFWSTQTEKMVSSLLLEDEGNQRFPDPRPAASAMALEGDHLVIGTWVLLHDTFEGTR